MPHPLKKILTLLPLLLAISFMSCTAESDTEDTNLLTNLYRGTEYVFENGWYLVSEFVPDYDRTENTVTVYAQKNTENDDGSIEYIGGFFTLYEDGTFLCDELFEGADGNSVYMGARTDDIVYYITYVKVDNGVESYLNRTDVSNGITTVSVNLDEILDETDYALKSLLCDGDGFPYVITDYSVYIFNSDLTPISRIPSDEFIKNAAVLSDGEVWINSYFNGKPGIAATDRENRKFRTEVTLSDKTDTLIGAYKDDEYDFYYMTDSAIYGAVIDENNIAVSTLLMDLVNSGIGYAGNKSWKSETEALLCATDSETFLFARRSGKVTLPVLFRRAEDIDLDTIKTITVAYTTRIDPDIIQKTVEFNKEHTDLRVVTVDYSIYAEERVADAEEKLAFDMVNGLCKPDIVIGYCKGEVARLLYENELYVDLVPYLENDGTVSSANLYDGVKRVFDDKNGGMWGISSSFSVDTLVASPDMLGEYAEKESWTLEEILDFLDSLPEDVEKTPANAFVPDYLLYSGFGMFIDLEERTCSFDSDLFKRYLSFVMTLPKTAAERKATSAYAKMSKAEQYYARASGKVALERAGLGEQWNYYVLDTIFGVGNYVPIGYATYTTTGTQIIPDDTYMITQYATDPDTCFELICRFFENDSATWYTKSFSSLRSEFERLREYYADTAQIYYLDGDRDTVKYDLSSTISEKELSKPGIVIHYSAEEWEKLEHIFDSSGSPAVDTIPEEIRDIVREEISYLIGGVGTAEDCAAKIQSRVGIWMAEGG